MTTVGYVLILLGLLVIRAVYKGRVQNIGQDASDAVLALIRGDTDALGEVLARTGDANSESQAETSMGPIPGTAQPPATDALLFSAVALGSQAKGYRWTATGPDYYDCSGLMWKAVVRAGLYNGPRFTTFNFESAMGDRFTRVTSPVRGDVVLWRTHHMGVVSGADQFYSARSVKSGIGYSAISTFRKDKPVYLRPTSLIKTQAGPVSSNGVSNV